MPDRSFLEWPFFDKEHRKVAGEVQKLIVRCASLHGQANFLAEEGDNERADDRCRHLVRLFGNGLLRHAVPAAFGGHNENLDVRSICLIRESLAYHSGLADFAFAMQGLGAGPISLYGSDAQKKKYLPKVASGEMISAFAISESEAGSDLRAMRTIAHRNGDHYVISGEKTWISNAELAHFYLVFCKFPERGEKAYLALAVPGTTPGLSIERFDVIAPHPIGTLKFQDCRVPLHSLVGEEGKGLQVALATLDIFRPSVGAAAVGFARRALDEATAHARKRNAFGKTLSEFQIIQAKLADMAVAIDASALLVYRAAWARDVLGHSITREAAMAKLHATEEAQRVIDEAVQILGARGVVSGSITERLYRDIRSLRIYEGTSEIQKLIIAGQVLKAAAGDGDAG